MTGRRVAGLGVTLAHPAAMESSVRAAVSAQIPVVVVNSGIGDWRDLGARLQQDRSIDRVLTLAAPAAVIALQAVGEANSYADVVTFDTDTAVIAAVERGTIGWAVDQQPFLQGYLAIDALWLYLSNRNVIGGGLPTLTGPAFVDGSNVDAVAEHAEEGTR